ncbi:hypothetical protein NC00_07895 [Xanthomonas cannabis pv. phaseoli]|uniref:Uncharacterized protein n=1 Tax=Xanthomonas cannabis pv. phaseoli TaxID=1885902 RepID=A0AB34P9H5_9XANT|nr:hypothetical protein NC00_07895 [Xanthomonas cannabis pv. phaseoli]
MVTAKAPHAEQTSAVVPSVDVAVTSTTTVPQTPVADEAPAPVRKPYAPVQTTMLDALAPKDDAAPAAPAMSATPVPPKTQQTQPAAVAPAATQRPDADAPKATVVVSEASKPAASSTDADADADAEGASKEDGDADKPRDQH